MDFSLKILIVEKRILLLVDNCQSKKYKTINFSYKYISMDWQIFSHSFLFVRMCCRVQNVICLVV